MTDGYFDGVRLKHFNSKIEYLIYDTNQKRLNLLEIDDVLRTKKNMSYEQWSTLHYAMDRIKEYIREADEELMRLSNGDGV